MNFNTVALKDTQSFSSFFLDYIQPKPELKPFYGLYPTIENLGKQTQNKSFNQEYRDTLVQALTQQYQSCSPSDLTSQNINSLQDANTYTIVTGHQLNIFTGPLYFIYKIVTAINTCKELKAKHPDQNFVPVYWMASEDHDFEEISYFYLFGKKYQWKTEQTGAVGRFNPKELEAIIGELPEALELFQKAYLEHDTLSDAVRYYINELFGSYGVVCVDGDDPLLKGQFSHVIKQDVLQQDIAPRVEKTSQELTDLGYSCQIKPRAINHFYLHEGIRERIIFEDGQYVINNTDLTFSSSEIEKLIDEHPDRFSPNVVLRPLYQEIILPNLAYIGGPAEMIYWLQLKDIFDCNNVPFPILLPRNFATIIASNLQPKIEKLEYADEQLFIPTSELQAQFVDQHATSDIDLAEDFEALQKVFDDLAEKANLVDGSLKGFIGAEYNKAQKSLGNIEKRLKKSEEKKHETELNQIESLKKKLFPSNGLQERHDNFMNFYLNHPSFIDDLVTGLQPLDFKMYLGRF